MDQEKIWNYYQNEQAGGDRFNASARYSFLARQIEPAHPVLNIGAGRGGLEELLLRKGADVHTLDPSSETIENLRRRFHFADKARQGYSQDIPFNDASFDVVIMSEVLEHLTDPVIASTLKEVVRVLRPGGRFIGTVPADENLASDQVVCPDCGKLFHRWGHVQEFSSDRLRSSLATAFKTVDVSRRYFGNWRTLNWKGRVLWMIKSTAVFLGIKGSGESLYFQARNC